MIGAYVLNTAPYNSSAISTNRARNALVRSRYGAALGALLLLFCGTANVCYAQSHFETCSDGTGDFETEFSTGVKLHVGAAMNGGLAIRACEGTLSWGKLNLVIVTGAALLDVDTVGVDLGVGVPVATFQVQKSNKECCRTYLIYSLQEPSRLLRVIAGGDTFSAADTDLDGRIEIWTDDAASVDGFEKLLLSELDFAPPIILRFEQGKLLDVSSEFQSYFDQKIIEEKADLTLQDLSDFKGTDGRLASNAPYPPHRLYQLHTVKMKVLEIVWSYLYSGREQQAWRSLADMWPAGDTDRIRAAILNARANGIRSQVDGVSTQGPIGRKKHARILDARTSNVALIETITTPSIIRPKPILIERPPPLALSEQGLPQSESELDLVIDSAGKVRSAKPTEPAQWVDPQLIVAAAKWKFIPAFSNGRPVASRFHFAVTLKR